MKKTMLTLQETIDQISTGRFLSLAGDEALLRQLPSGNWIGGTIPYFIGDQGGLESRELIHVTELAEPGTKARIADYTRDTISGIAREAPENGFTILIIPGMSSLHTEFAAHASQYEDLFMKPIAGWISGVHLNDLGKVTPKVFNGQTGQASDSQAVAVHVPLPPTQLAVVRILNLFRQGKGDTLVFPKDGFTATECLVNGKMETFAQYIDRHQLDLSRPLVADYSGAQINVSFQHVDSKMGEVHFYAPVVSGVEYRHAEPIDDYEKAFEALVEGLTVAPRFTCNCILNYVHGKLEGRRTGGFTGPMTFGEIGYQVLNQTLVYIEIVE